MQQVLSPSPEIVTDHEAAQLLINPRTLAYLQPFLGWERSVTQAAREVGLKPNSMLWQVGRFVKLGLLEVTRELPRKGRAVKLYRTTSDCFFVPYRATLAESLEAAMAQKERYWEELFRYNLMLALGADFHDWGLRIYRSKDGLPIVCPTPVPDLDYTPLGPEHPATYSVWVNDIQLDFEDAKRLQGDLVALLSRYHQKRGAQRYLLRLGMTPLVDELK